MHGAVTLVEKKLAIVNICVQDEFYVSHCGQIAEVKRRGSLLCQLSQTSSTIEPRLAAITILQRFYLDIEMIAVAMGYDPDNPVGLKKITKTV